MPKFGSHIVGQNFVQLKECLLEVLASAPAGSAEGRSWYRSEVGNNRIQFQDSSGPVDVPRLDYAETVTKKWEFNPDASGAPFTIGANSQNWGTNKITWLNADRVDGFDTSQSAANSSIAVRNGDGTLTVATPTNLSHAATKEYVDDRVSGSDSKGSVRAATTTALPANTRTGNVLTASANGALPAQDGIDLGVTDRLNVMHEGGSIDTPHAHNGPYEVTVKGDAGTPWELTRIDTADEDAEFTSGLEVFVSEGTVHSGAIYSILTKDPITINTTAVKFGQTGGQTLYSAGNGMVLSGAIFHFGKSGQYSVGSLFFADAVDGVDELTPVAFGSVLLSNGNASPNWGKVNLTQHVSSTLPIANGGTNSNSGLNNGRVMISKSGAIVERAALTASALVMGDGTDGLASIPIGSSNQLIGVNSGGTAYEHKNLIVTSAGTVTSGTWQGSVINTGYGGTGTSTAFTGGSVVFAGSSGVYAQDNGNFFWDNINKRLGVGTPTPDSLLTAYGPSPVINIATNGVGNPEIQFTDNGTDEFSIYYDTNSNSLKFVEGGVGTKAVIKDGGNFGVAKLDPAYKLDVAGDINIDAGQVYRVNGNQIDTDDVLEGANLYYTDARARASLSGTAGHISYDSSTGVIDVGSTVALKDAANLFTANQLIESSDVDATMLTFTNNAAASTSNVTRFQFKSNSSTQIRQSFQINTGWSDITDATRTSITKFESLESGVFATALELDGFNVNVPNGEIQIGGTSINTAGNLSNVAYLNQAQTFAAKQTISTGGLDVTGTTTFQSLTASQYVKTDVSKNLTTVSSIPAGDITAGTFGTGNYVINGTLTLNGVRTDAQNAVEISPYGSGAGQTGEIRFVELDVYPGANYVGVKAPDDIAASLIWTLPAVDGADSTYFMRTNGSGILTFAQVTWTSVQNKPSTFTPSAHTHPATDINTGTFADARIAQSNVTQHEAALSLTTAQTVSGTFANARISQSSVTQHEAALSLTAAQTISGTFSNARISQSSVTQHEAALTLSASQTTTGTFADAQISQSSVTQHEAALSIAWSQLTNVPTTITHKASGTLGDGSNSTYTVSHNLGTTSIFAWVRLAGTDAWEIVDFKPSGTNAVEFTFDKVPSTNEYEWFVIG